MVTRENYEEYLILYADGELDAAAERQLMSFLNKHPDLKEELAMYESVRLEPDTTIVYASKEALLKQPAAKKITLGNWWAYGAAAGVALIIGISLFRTAPASGPEIAGNHSWDMQAAPATRTPVVPVHPAQNTIAVQQTQTIAPSKKEIHQPQALQREQIASIEPTQSKPLPSTAREEVVTGTGKLDVPEPKQIIREDENNASGLVAALPISEGKKQDISNFKDAMQNTFAKAGSNIKATNVVFKFGHRSINF